MTVLYEDHLRDSRNLSTNYYRLLRAIYPEVFTWDHVFTIPGRFESFYYDMDTKKRRSRASKRAVCTRYRIVHYIRIEITYLHEALPNVQETASVIGVKGWPDHSEFYKYLNIYEFEKNVLDVFKADVGFKLWNLHDYLVTYGLRHHRRT